MFRFMPRPLPRSLIRGKLEEQGIADEVDLRIIPMGGELDLASFHFQFMPLAHSIPEMSALVIDTPYGKIFHTGDWKLDEQPVIGKPSTAAQLKGSW